ncbi:hypothetical protein [Streptomyces violascens]|nr:hypothetical protein [Streptomyces violascens]
MSAPAEPEGSLLGGSGGRRANSTEAIAHNGTAGYVSIVVT